MRVRGALFDLDGTLVDSYDAIHESLNAALAAKGFAPLSHEAVRRMVGRGLESLMADALSPDLVEEGVRLFRAHYRTVFLEKTRLLPGVADTVAALHARGVRLAVCSNKPGYFSLDILAHLGVGHLFSAVLGPEHTARPKPDPSMLHLALARLEVAPAEALYVGDMPMDVTVARAAGVPVALVFTGSANERQVRAAGADHVLDAIGELLHIVKPE